MRILAMSGFVPEQICDTVRFCGYTGERELSHYCGYANDYISQVLNDETIDGAVFPRSCDSSRIIKSYLEKCGKFLYQIHVPTRNDDVAVAFLAAEIENYKNCVETFFQETLGDIPSRIQKINSRNQLISDYYTSLETYSYVDYLRSIHRIMSQPLMDREMEIQAEAKKGMKKRIYLVGSFLANEKIAEIIEDNGLGIVGDNLPESGRIHAGGVVEETGGGVYYAIATAILSNRLSPTQGDFSRILEDDFKEMKDLGVDAVIFVTQKYCEPYDYLYSVYKKKLDSEGIPSLKLSLTNSEDLRKITLSVEAFSESL